MKTIIRQIALCIALQVCCAQAYAHAFLDRASPAVGSTVHGSPGEIRLCFSVPLEHAFSTVKVLDKAGRQVDGTHKHVERSDPTQIKLSVPPLAHGTYRVVWHVLSADKHAADGDFTFDVVP